MWAPSRLNQSAWGLQTQVALQCFNMTGPLGFQILPDGQNAHQLWACEIDLVSPSLVEGVGEGATAAVDEVSYSPSSHKAMATEPPCHRWSAMKAVCEVIDPHDAVTEWRMGECPLCELCMMSYDDHAKKHFIGAVVSKTSISRFLALLRLTLVFTHIRVIKNIEKTFGICLLATYHAPLSVPKK